MLIQISNLQKTYHMGPTEVYALRGVNLEVAHGEFAAIMGASGSGKSTMLHLLGCLDRPSAGMYRLALQRRFCALAKFARVESRLSGRKL